MSTLLKARPQSKPKSGKVNPAKQQGVKKSQKKSGRSSPQGKGKSQPSSTGTAQDTQSILEKVVHELEPAGEDDHEFFDEEENAGYAKFMLSLEESELTTFSKRAKDRVAVAPTSKKKRSTAVKTSVVKVDEITPPAAEVPADDKPSIPAANGTAVNGAVDGSAIKRKEAIVDAKRRKASTVGWVEEDTGPARLPIKTRKGVLKPNQRMQHSAASAADAARGDATEADGATSTANKKGMDVDDDRDHAGAPENRDVIPKNVADDMSDSVYDSADSDFEPDDVVGLSDSIGAPTRAAARAGAGVDLAVLKQRRFVQKKSLMAELCETILGSPEESLMQPKTVPKGEDSRSRMEQLFALVEDDDHRVRHLALLSQYAVFKDIIPSYRIRVPTAVELATKVSKEVHRVRAQEAALLKAYQQYLKALEAVIQAAVSSSGATSAPGARALAAAAIQCMCGLLSAHPHFNFRSNLVRTVVAGTNHKLAEVRAACCRCLGGVFTEDVQGEVSLEIAKAVAKYAKDRKFHVSEGTVRCLAALPLRIREDERARAKARVKSKNRKRRREGSVEAGLMEAEANVDDDIRAKCQADALHEVMLTYFRVLKRRPPPPALFPAVMEGLAKFVHLVNLDTVQDLLDLLKDLLAEEEGVNELPLQPALHCILAAFRALQGPGRELQTDEAAFVSALYRRLPDLLRAEGGDGGGQKTAECVVLVYDCLDAALGKRKELSIARVTAMVKRLLSVSLQLTQSANPTWGAGAGGLLRGAHRLVLRYPAAQQLLENEQDRPGAGPYRPDLANPEHANALSSAAWELSLLRHSSEPAIVAVVRDIVAVGSQDAASALAALHERGREARESGAGQGTLASCFVGVPLPEGRAIALGKTGLLDGASGSEDKKGGGSKGQQQKKKKAVPKDGVDLKSALLIRLARAGGEERS